jgi:hypothetical protein
MISPRLQSLRGRNPPSALLKVAPWVREVQYWDYILIVPLSEGRQPVTPVDGAGCGALRVWPRQPDPRVAPGPRPTGITTRARGARYTARTWFVRVRKRGPGLVGTDPRWRASPERRGGAPRGERAASMRARVATRIRFAHTAQACVRGRGSGWMRRAALHRPSVLFEGNM